MNKKRYILLLIIFIIAGHGRAKAQEFIWARQGNNAQTAGSVIMDNGDSYVSGLFSDSVNFDGIRLFSGTGLTRTRMFLAKYGVDGKIGWAIQNSGKGDAKVVSMCRDNSNHLYLMGEFQDSVSVGNIGIFGDPGIFSYFIAKYDINGNPLWVRVYNNSYAQFSYDIRLAKITCDRQNNIYVMGYADKTYNANGISFSNNGNWADIFLSKLEPATGLGLWTKTVKGSVIKFPRDITTDFDNNVIITGEFGMIGAPPLTQYIALEGTDTFRITPGMQINSFVAKYGSSGTYKWGATVGTMGRSQLSGLTCDTSRNIYITGDIGDTANGNMGHRFISKLDSTGVRTWIDTGNVAFSALASSKNGLFVNIGFNDTLRYHGIQRILRGEHNVIMKLDVTTGLPIWTSQPFDNSTSFCFLSASADDRSILFTGHYGRKMRMGNNLLYDNNRDFMFHSLLMDTTVHPTANNVVSGNIYNDTNANCIKNLAEPGLKTFSVMAEPGPYYAVADSIGNYNLKLGTGNFLIRQLVPVGHDLVDSQHCVTTGYAVSLPSTNQVIPNKDFGNKYRSCSLLKITAQGNHFECGKTKIQRYTICNYGTDTAYNSMLKIKYPGYLLSPVSSSIPWTSYTLADTTLTFNLGNIGPDSCFTFTVTDTAACLNTFQYMGQRFPFTGSLTPLNSCYISDTTNNFVRFNYPPAIPIGINNIPSEREISLYPNPTNGLLFVEGLADESNVQVYTMFGQKVLERKVKGSRLELDLTAEQSGIYLLIIRGEQGSLSKKLIKL